VLTAGQAKTILDDCRRLLGRLQFALLLGTGVRIGKRSCCGRSAWRSTKCGHRDAENDNRARAKAGRSQVIPAT
jgi:hypothetical protein